MPKTWDDVLAASLKLKEGMEKPIVYEYNQELPNFYDAFVAQVYGRGGEMFDENLEPLFNDPESEAFKQLQWLQDAFSKHQIVAPETHESKIIPAMNTGKHAFTIVFNYVLAAMNNAAEQPRAGEFDLRDASAMHSTLGFAKLYAMTRRPQRTTPGATPAWSSSSTWVAATTRSPSAGRSRRGWASRSCRCSTTRRCSAYRAGSTREVQAAGDASQERHLTEWTGSWTVIGRCSPRRWGEASVAEVMDAGAAKWVRVPDPAQGK